jgi:hypothetical protein
MARLRHDSSARGLVYEPLWEWIVTGRPKTQESEREHFSGMAWWLTWQDTGHWHPCAVCGEGTPERAMRLLTTALDEGVIGLSDDEWIALDDGNTKAVIAALDEIEPAPSWQWFRDHQCANILISEDFG